MITEIERQQLAEKYFACELVELLSVSVHDILDVFEQEVEDRIYFLLDKERGIGL